MATSYQPRKIEFQELVTVDDWQVKVYTIAKDVNMDASTSYQKPVSKLAEWLKMGNSFDDSYEKMAFLIVHVGTEGIFSIINWWVGKNMLNTHIFLSKHDTPAEFKKISGDGLAPCVWEFEVIYHESKSWMKNILKLPNTPDYITYVNDTYNEII